MRTIPKFGEERLAELDAAWSGKHEERERKKLQVIKLAAGHKLTAAEIGKAVGVGRDSVFRYMKLFREGGVQALLAVGYRNEDRSRVDVQTQGAIVEELRKGSFRRAKDMQRWLSARGITLALSSVYYWLGKSGGVLKMPRKTHAKKDAAKVEEFRTKLSEKLKDMAGRHRKVRVWAADEHRYGLLPVIRRCWGLRKERVYAPYATNYKWGYLYEAVEVDGRHRSEFLFLPTVRKDLSKMFLKRISRAEKDALHIVIWDGAGFHAKDGEEGVPANVKLLRLPPYSPELNPVEDIGDRIKDAVCNKLYPTLEALEADIWGEIESIKGEAKGFGSMIHDWMRLQVNSSGKILKYVFSS